MEKKALKIILYYLLRHMHSGFMPQGKEKESLDWAIEKLKIDTP